MNTSSVAAKSRKLTYDVALDLALSAINMADHIAGDEFTKQEVYDKIVALRAQLEKKSSAPKKPTKVQAENEQVKNLIAEVMVDIPAKTVTDIQNLHPTLKAMSNQKCAALIRQLVDEGRMTKVVEGRKSLFKLAGE